jgi:hypothetical protein
MEPRFFSIQPAGTSSRAAHRVRPGRLRRKCVKGRHIAHEGICDETLLGRSASRAGAVDGEGGPRRSATSPTSGRTVPVGDDGILVHRRLGRGRPQNLLASTLPAGTLTPQPAGRVPLRRGYDHGEAAPPASKAIQEAGRGQRRLIGRLLLLPYPQRLRHLLHKVCPNQEQPQPPEGQASRQAATAVTKGRLDSLPVLAGSVEYRARPSDGPSPCTLPVCLHPGQDLPYRQRRLDSAMLVEQLGQGRSGGQSPIPIPQGAVDARPGHLRARNLARPGVRPTSGALLVGFGPSYDMLHGQRRSV